MKRILVVEDEFQICQAMKMLLEGDGYEVNCAFNGREGLEAIDRSPPDLILLDYVMPVLTGREFLDLLQQRRAKIPIVLMSEVETIAASAPKIWKGFLKKPFTVDSLLSVVSKAL